MQFIISMLEQESSQYQFAIFKHSIDDDGSEGHQNFQLCWRRGLQQLARSYE